jgi:hypothetical protein
MDLSAERVPDALSARARPVLFLPNAPRSAGDGDAGWDYGGSARARSVGRRRLSARASCACERRGSAARTLMRCAQDRAAPLVTAYCGPRYVIRMPCVFRAHTTRIYGASHTAARSQDLLVTYADSISCVSKCRFVSYSSRSRVGYFHRSFALQARAVSGLAHTRQARANRAFSSQPATLRVGLTPVTWSVSRSEDTSQCMHAPHSRGGTGLGVCLLYLPSPVLDRQNALYYNHYNAWE